MYFIEMQLYSITHLHSRSFILYKSCKTHSCCYMNIVDPVIHPHPETPLGARTCYPSCWEWCQHTAFSCQLLFENDLAEERCLSQALGLSLRVAELHWLTHRGVHRASLLPQFQTSLMGDYFFKTLCSVGNLPKESVGTRSKLTFSFCPVLPAPFTSDPADPSSTSRSRLEPVQLSSVHLFIAWASHWARKAGSRTHSTVLMKTWVLANVGKYTWGYCEHSSIYILIKIFVIFYWVTI